MTAALLRHAKLPHTSGEHGQYCTYWIVSQYGCQAKLRTPEHVASSQCRQEVKSWALAAGLAREEQDRGVVGTPVRQEIARPIDSTTAMAAAVAPALR